MFTSWNGWLLPHVRWIWALAYTVAALAALALGAGVWSVLIGLLAALAVCLPLELRARHRHEPPVRNDFSRYP
jgi:hypothetical protein